MRRTLADDFNSDIDFITVSPAKINKEPNVPAYARGLRVRVKRVVTVKDEAAADKKKAQQAEAALKRKEKQEAKKKENEAKKKESEAKKKENEAKRKAAELQKKKEAELRKKKMDELQKDEEAGLQKECVVTNDEVLAEENALAPESDV